MRILQTLYAFSGNAPPQLAVMRELVERGHEVRALAHEAGRERVEATGAEFVPFRRVLPDMDLTYPETDPIRDWAARSPAGAAYRFRNRAIFDPAEDCVAEVEQLIASFAPEAVVFDVLILGAAVAAEHAGIPAVALVHCPYPLPAKGVPPLFSGLSPMDGPIGRLRDASLRRLTDRFYRPGLPLINRLRAARGLAPLEHWNDQLLGVHAIDVLTAPELDFASRGELPPNVHYAGPAFEPFTNGWQSPWPADHTDPLVVMSFSTSYMNQVPLAQRVLDSIDGLPVRALLTAGPALEADKLQLPANAHVVSFVPHRAVMPHASLVITHAGWQTVNAALAAGVPLVCIPDGRDQPDNAARVVAAGAGVRVRKSISPKRLRTVIAHALAHPALRDGAKRTAVALARRDGARFVADQLEAIPPATRDPSTA